jgi:hypothetical protein
MGNRTKQAAKQKYPRRPQLRRFETYESGPVFFDPADVNGIRPAGGAWEGKVAWVSTGGTVEYAMPGTVDEVHARLFS